VAALLLLSGMWLNQGFAQKPPTAENTLMVAIGANPAGLFPPTQSDGETTAQVSGRLFESLLDRDIETYEWEPLIAQSWTISPDGKTFTFVLDPRARFWDGSPVTPEDVKFSYDIILRKGVDSAPLRPYYSAIDKVEIKDKQTVIFRTKDSYYKNFDVAAGLTIFKKDFYEKLYALDNSLSKATTNRQAMGTGKWQVEKWDENRQMILRRDPAYWNREHEIKEGTWNFDRIILTVIPDNTVKLESLKKGNLSYLGATSKQFAREMNGPPFGTKVTKVKATNKAPVNYSYIAWNQQHPILGNKDVRWAMSHLLNLSLWIKKFDFDLAEPTIGPFSPKSDQHDPQLKPVAFDPSAARARLAAAGWTQAGPDGFLVKDGKRFEITIMYPTQAKDVREPILTEYKNQAKKVGVDIKLRALEWTSFVKMMDERKFDAVILAWTRAVDGDLKQIFHTDSAKDQGSNFISYSNPALDKLIDEHRQTLDYDKRVLLARQMQRMIYEDQPYSFLTEPKHVLYAHQNTIEKQKDAYNYGIGVDYWKFALQAK
jgi:peptide/nickel transport system substrate-binding protein/microcin C transport system substrate-binding protein